MRVFFDLEFTGLHQYTTPISIGLVAEDGCSFYAEFTDYDLRQIDDWLRTNVLPNLWSQEEQVQEGQSHIKKDLLAHFEQAHYDITMIGTRFEIVQELTSWLEQFEAIEMWGDCIAYDWVLFCELFGGGAECLPRNILYLPFDITTVFKMQEIDPDINRMEFANRTTKKHHALWDAIITKACYERLMA